MQSIQSLIEDLVTLTAGQGAVAELENDWFNQFKEEMVSYSADQLKVVFEMPFRNETGGVTVKDKAVTFDDSGKCKEIEGLAYGKRKTPNGEQVKYEPMPGAYRSAKSIVQQCKELGISMGGLGKSALQDAIKAAKKAADESDMDESKATAKLSQAIATAVAHAEKNGLSNEQIRDVVMTVICS